MESVKSGYLTKEGGSWKNWQKRWCVLTPTGMIFYFKDKKDSNSRGCVDLNIASEITIEDDKRQFCFGIHTPTRTYYMTAENKNDREAWIQACQRFIKKQSQTQTQPTGTGSAVQTNPNEPKKKTVDDYEMISLIGRGSFGKVMQVKEIATGKIYAMKILNKQHIMENNEQDHIMSEKSVLAKNNNPFLMHLHHSFQ